MTKEEFFRAVGEVREDQVTEAETMKKQGRPWRRYVALAACFAVVLAAGTAVNGPYPTGYDSGRGQVSASAVTDSSLDGSDYSIPEDAPAQPVYSTGVEIAELDETEDENILMVDSCAVSQPEPEEIFTHNTVIFRGTVRNLRYFEVTAEVTTYYTVASVEITDCIRGELEPGDIYNVLYPGAKNRMRTGSLVEDLKVGSDAVFMPYVATMETGWQGKDSSYFCYADLAELYFEDGIHFLFLDTGEGLAFERSVYADIADAETLDAVMAYLRKAVPNADEPREASQPAQTPMESQARPSATAQARDAGQLPGGARELPSGAVVEEGEFVSK